MQEQYENYHIKLGITHAIKGWHDRAIEEFKLALNINPNSGLAYYNLGNVYKNKNLFIDAIDTYEKALSLCFKIPEIYNNLGICYARQKEFDKALNVWEQGLKQNSDHLDIKKNIEKLKLIKI